MLIMSVLHQHHCMIWLNYIDNCAWLASVHSLQETNTFTNLEELFETSTLNFDRNRHFLLSFHLNDTCLIIDLLHNSRAALELAWVDFASVADVNLKLRVISDSLKDCWVRKQIPFILIRVVGLKQFAWCWIIDLKSADLLEHRAHILN